MHRVTPFCYLELGNWDTQDRWSGSRLSTSLLMQITSSYSVVIWDTTISEEFCKFTAHSVINLSLSRGNCHNVQIFIQLQSSPAHWWACAAWKVPLWAGRVGPAHKKIAKNKNLVLTISYSIHNKKSFYVYFRWSRWSSVLCHDLPKDSAPLTHQVKREKDQATQWIFP